MPILDEIKQGEGKRLELKEKLPSPEALAKTVVAFSNTSGGKIIIGVRDNREIIGINETDILQLEEKISSIIYDLCYPNILPEIYTVYVEGKLLLVVEVFRGSLLPYYLKNKGKRNGTYIRIGSTNRQADEQMILELERQRRGKTFDEEENFEYDIADLDLTPIYVEFSKAGKVVDYNKLKNLKLIKTVNNKDVPTNALLIVLGKFDNVSVKCARFKGSTMDEFIDKKEFTGTLFHLLDSTITFLKNHLNLHAKIEGLRRVEKYEIPEVALREAILNALIHRDYTRESDIKVAIYDDIVEIISPGALPNGITLADISDGRSELRNKVVANLFKELGYVEIWGSGIAKIRQVCQNQEIDFKIEERGGFVAVEFLRQKSSKSEQIKLSANLRQNLDEHSDIELTDNYLKSIGLNQRQIQAISYIKKNGKITNKEYQALNKVSKRTASRDLKELVSLNILEKIGTTGKGAYYIIKGTQTGHKGDTNGS